MYRQRKKLKKTRKYESLPVTLILRCRAPRPPGHSVGTLCPASNTHAPRATVWGSGRQQRSWSGGPWSGRAQDGYTDILWTQRSSWQYVYTSASWGCWAAPWLSWTEPRWLLARCLDPSSKMPSDGYTPRRLHDQTDHELNLKLANVKPTQIYRYPLSNGAYILILLLLVIYQCQNECFKRTFYRPGGSTSIHKGYISHTGWRLQNLTLCRNIFHKNIPDVQPFVQRIPIVGSLLVRHKLCGIIWEIYFLYGTIW